MRKTAVLAALLISIFGCSAHNAGTGGAASNAVKVRISAEPRQGFASLRVNFHALLEGVEDNNSDYYCLKREWDFGDGSVSSEKPNCTPFSADSKVETEFFVDHLYENEGIYEARFTLGDKKITSNRYTITVLQDSSKPNF